MGKVDAHKIELATAAPALGGHTNSACYRVRVPTVRGMLHRRGGPMALGSPAVCDKLNGQKHGSQLRGQLWFGPLLI